MIKKCVATFDFKYVMTPISMLPRKETILSSKSKLGLNDAVVT